MDGIFILVPHPYKISGSTPGCTFWTLSFLWQNFFNITASWYLYGYGKLPKVCVNYKEGRSQRLKKEDANERHQDKKAIAADNWYLLHNFSLQKVAGELTNASVTLAVEHAAASERNDRTYNHFFIYFN